MGKLFNIFDTEVETEEGQADDLIEHISGLPTEKTYLDDETGDEIVTPIDNTEYIKRMERWDKPKQRVTDDKWCTAVCEHSTAEGRTIEEEQPDWFPVEEG